MANYTPLQLSDFPWIVSIDTLREQDLLPRFWGIAEQLGAPIPDSLLAALQSLEGTITADWDFRLAAETCFELIDLLNDVAPVGFYFGASDGDGACFGFWVTESWANALDHMNLGECDPSGWAELIADLDSDGIDPETIEDSYQGTAEGWSEERAGADYAQTLADELGLLKAAQWPFSCIDWVDAWRELAMGDGYRLHSIGGGEWLVFRNS